MESPSNTVDHPPDQELVSTEQSFSNKAVLYLGRIPVVRRLPPRVVGIIFTIGVVNIAVWVGVIIILVGCYEQYLLSNR